MVFFLNDCHFEEILAESKRFTSIDIVTIVSRRRFLTNFHNECYLVELSAYGIPTVNHERGSLLCDASSRNCETRVMRQFSRTLGLRPSGKVARRAHAVKSAGRNFTTLRGAEKHLLFAVLEAILVILVTASSGLSGGPTEELEASLRLAESCAFVARER